MMNTAVTRLLMATISWLILQPVWAGIILNEQFGSSLNDTAGDAGLSGTWDIVYNSTGGSMNYQAGGLNFGTAVLPYGPTGGSVQVDNGGGASDLTIRRTLNLSHSGDAFGMFLLRPDGNYGGGGKALVGFNTGTVWGGATDEETIEWALSAQNGATVQTPSGNERTEPGAHMNAGSATISEMSNLPGAGVGTERLLAGETYLFLYKMGNVVSSGSAAQSLDMWVMNEDQWAGLKIGGLTEAELNAASTGTAGELWARWRMTTASSGATLQTGDSLFLAALNNANSNSTFDEIRISDTSFNELLGLDAQTGIPEPSSMGLIAFGSILLRRQLQRRRRSSTPRAVH